MSLKQTKKETLTDNFIKQDILYEFKYLGICHNKKSKRGQIMKKSTLLYFAVLFIVLIGNILIVLTQISNANISVFSYPAVFFMVLMITHATLAYLLRHKVNCLPFRRFAHINPFASDKDVILKDKYLYRFFFMLKVYCLAIPFYIPQIFLTSNYIQSIWALVTFFCPQVVYIIMGVRDTFKDVKADKLKKEQLEQERLEQERREEQGKWR